MNYYYTVQGLPTIHMLEVIKTGQWEGPHCKKHLVKMTMSEG